MMKNLGSRLLELGVGSSSLRSCSWTAGSRFLIMWGLSFLLLAPKTMVVASNDSSSSETTSLYEQCLQADLRATGGFHWFPRKGCAVLHPSSIRNFSSNNSTNGTAQLLAYPNVPFLALDASFFDPARNFVWIANFTGANPDLFSHCLQFCDATFGADGVSQHGGTLLVHQAPDPRLGGWCTCQPANTATPLLNMSNTSDTYCTPRWLTDAHTAIVQVITSRFGCPLVDTQNAPCSASGCVVDSVGCCVGYDPPEISRSGITLGGVVRYTIIVVVSVVLLEGLFYCFMRRRAHRRALLLERMYRLTQRVRARRAYRNGMDADGLLLSDAEVNELTDTLMTTLQRGGELADPTAPQATAGTNGASSEPDRDQLLPRERQDVVEGSASKGAADTLDDDDLGCCVICLEPLLDGVQPSRVPVPTSGESAGPKSEDLSPPAEGNSPPSATAALDSSSPSTSFPTVTTLPCRHRLHSTCLREYVAHKVKGLVGIISCPTCRLPLAAFDPISLSSSHSGHDAPLSVGSTDDDGVPQEYNEAAEEAEEED